MTTIQAVLTDDGVEITANMSRVSLKTTYAYKDLIRPGEYFGGISFEQWQEIATTTGQIDAMDLKV